MRFLKWCSSLYFTVGLIIPLIIVFVVRTILQFVFEGSGWESMGGLASSRFEEWIIPFQERMEDALWFKIILASFMVNLLAILIKQAIFLVKDNRIVPAGLNINHSRLGDLHPELLVCRFDCEIDKGGFVKAQRRFLNQRLGLSKSVKDIKKKKSIQRIYRAGSRTYWGRILIVAGALGICSLLLARSFTNQEANLTLVENRSDDMPFGKGLKLSFIGIEFEFSENSSMAKSYGAELGIERAGELRESIRVEQDRPGYSLGNWIYLETYSNTGKTGPVIDFTEKEGKKMIRIKKAEIGKEFSLGEGKIRLTQFESQTERGGDAVNLMYRHSDGKEAAFWVYERIPPEGVPENLSNWNINLRGLFPIYEARFKIIRDPLFFWILLPLGLVILGFIFWLPMFRNTYWLSWSPNEVFLVCQSNLPTIYEARFRAHSQSFLQELEKLDPSAHFEYSRGGQVHDYG